MTSRSISKPVVVAPYRIEREVQTNEMNQAERERKGGSGAMLGRKSCQRCHLVVDLE